jgi:hypothetical protein
MLEATMGTTTMLLTLTEFGTIPILKMISFTLVRGVLRYDF